MTKKRKNAKNPQVSLLMLKSREIAAGEFKARCLQLMDEVAKTGVEIVVTKHRKPVARVVPVRAGDRGFCGSLRGWVTKQKDLVSPTGAQWTADEPNIT
jgi:prevent-host-death family protein